MSSSLLSQHVFILSYSNFSSEVTLALILGRCDKTWPHGFYPRSDIDFLLVSILEKITFPGFSNQHYYICDCKLRVHCYSIFESYWSRFSFSKNHVKGPIFLRRITYLPQGSSTWNANTDSPWIVLIICALHGFQICSRTMAIKQ